MVSISDFKKIALSFPETAEQPHFEKISFRIKNKIFATLAPENKTAVVKLSAVDQSVFCTFDNTMIYPVNGAWGKQGWTTIELKTIHKDMLTDALTCAYCAVAPKKLADPYRKM